MLISKWANQLSTALGSLNAFLTSPHPLTYIRISKLSITGTHLAGILLNDLSSLKSPGYSNTLDYQVGADVIFSFLALGGALTTAETGLT